MAQAGFEFYLPVYFINSLMKKITVLLFLLFIGISIYARKEIVSTASEITSAIWYAGDTIVLKNGTWTNQSISLRAEGTSDMPIVLMAETPGQVILNGTSKLAFSGKYILIDGLYFKDGNLSGSDVISFRTSSSSLAENCRLTNTTIENYNPPLKTTDSKWVSLYGKNNRVDHCSFINKTNSGTLLVVWLASGTTPNHTIDYNYFGYRNANLDNDGNELNGQEIIRIGDSSHSMQTAGVVVSNNFFEHCNGEIEIISNKSCENIFSNNVFYECSGMLTLRHGNRCTVEGNYFFGNGVSESGGVRIIGEDHKVYNNYFENLTGTGYRAALCIVRGKEDSELNEYFQVKNALVAFNTFVNCKQSFSINYNSSTSLTLPPIGTNIAHNHVYNTSSSNNNVAVYLVNVEAMDISWKNNLMNQGVYYNFTYTNEEIIEGIDPSMALVTTPINIYEPELSSALGDYTTDEYSSIVTDIRGRDRGTAKVPGSSQLSGTISLEMPIKSEIGSSYYPPGITNVYKDLINHEFTAYSYDNQVYTNLTEKGVLCIYDLSGRCLYIQKMEKGQNNFFIKEKGIFILRFVSENGSAATKKIVCN